MTTRARLTALVLHKNVNANYKIKNANKIKLCILNKPFFPAQTLNTLSPD